MAMFPDQVYGFGGQALGKFHNLIAAAERGVSNVLGITDALDYASKRPGQIGYGYDDHRGAGDAMRHILMSAELHRTHPRLAGPILWGHEFLTGTMHGQPSEEREQDLYNNAIGAQIGQIARSRDDIERMAKIAMPKSRILPPDDYRY